MKLFVATLIGIIGLAAAPSVEKVEVPIDSENSTVAWTGYKVTGSHNGTINVKSGKLIFEDNKLTGGEIVMDMTSIQVADLSGESADKLVGHLKSDDFFGVEKHPTAMFKITKVASRGKADDYKVSGNLQIKGISKPISFNIIAKSNGAKAEVTIDRSDYNIRYGSGSFFDNLGDKTIYDEFDLTIKLAY